MRLIDADALATKIMMEVPDFLDGGSSITKAFVLAMVKTRSVTPTIDAVPVVRCKYCEMNNQCSIQFKFADADDPDNWFCPNGKRKE